MIYERICRSVQHFVCTKAHKKRKLDSCLMNIDCQRKGENLCRERLTGSTLICAGRIEMDMPLNLKYGNKICNFKGIDVSMQHACVTSTKCNGP